MMETFQKDSNTLSINEVDSEFSPPTHEHNKWRNKIGNRFNCEKLFWDEIWMWII